MTLAKGRSPELFSDTIDNLNRWIPTGKKGAHENYYSKNAFYSNENVYDQVPLCKIEGQNLLIY